MAQPDIPSPNIPSPCIGVCKLDRATRRCEGCLRTIEEIVGWPDATNEERRAILEATRERRSALARTATRQ